jgi:hypothetical protein
MSRWQEDVELEVVEVEAAGVLEYVQMRVSNCCFHCRLSRTAEEKLTDVEHAACERGYEIR